MQYAASTGNSWQVTNLTGSIAPGAYYLVQESAGTGGTTASPPPDASASIAMSGTAGKVALVNGTTALTTSNPTGAVDLVGYGSGTNGFEGSGPRPDPEQHHGRSSRQQRLDRHRQQLVRFRHRHARPAQQRLAAVPAHDHRHPGPRRDGR